MRCSRSVHLILILYLFLQSETRVGVVGWRRVDSDVSVPAERTSVLLSSDHVGGSPTSEVSVDEGASTRTRTSGTRPLRGAAKEQEPLPKKILRSAPPASTSGGHVGGRIWSLLDHTAESISDLVSLSASSNDQPSANDTAWSSQQGGAPVSSPSSASTSSSPTSESSSTTSSQAHQDAPVQEHPGGPAGSAAPSPESQTASQTTSDDQALAQQSSPPPLLQQSSPPPLQQSSPPPADGDQVQAMTQERSDANTTSNSTSANTSAINSTTISLNDMWSRSG